MAETRPRAGLLAGEESTAGGSVVVGDGGAGVSGRNKIAGVYRGLSLPIYGAILWDRANACCLYCAARHSAGWFVYASSSRGIHPMINFPCRPVSGWTLIPNTPSLVLTIFADV